MPALIRLRRSTDTCCQGTHVTVHSSECIRPDRPLRAPEAARVLSVHIHTLKRIPTSDLPYFRIGNRGDRRYWPSDIEAYIERRVV